MLPHFHSSLLSAHLTVTNPRDHKIRGKLNIPSHANDKNWLVDGELAVTCSLPWTTCPTHSQMHSWGYHISQPSRPNVTMLALQAMSPGPEKHLTVTCTDGQMDGGGQVEITWCSSLLAQHIPALAAVVCIQAGHWPEPTWCPLEALSRGWQGAWRSPNPASHLMTGVLP